jgi:hypothetical protein
VSGVSAMSSGSVSTSECLWSSRMSCIRGGVPDGDNDRGVDGAGDGGDDCDSDGGVRNGDGTRGRGDGTVGL